MGNDALLLPLSAMEKALLALVILNRPVDIERLIQSVGASAEALGEALVLAARRGKQELVDLLLRAGAPLEYRGFGGRTALESALSERKLRVVAQLLDHGATASRNEALRILNADPVESHLLLAAKTGKIAGVDSALAQGASLLARDQFGHSLLRVAASRGHCEMVTHLLELEAMRAESFDLEEVISAYLVGPAAVQQGLARRLEEEGIREEQIPDLYDRWINSQLPRQFVHRQRDEQISQMLGDRQIRDKWATALE